MHRRLECAAAISVGDLIFPYENPEFVVSNVQGESPEMRIISWGGQGEGRVVLRETSLCLLVTLSPDERRDLVISALRETVKNEQRRLAQRLPRTKEMTLRQGGSCEPSLPDGAPPPTNKGRRRQRVRFAMEQFPGTSTVDYNRGAEASGSAPNSPSTT